MQELVTKACYLAFGYNNIISALLFFTVLVVIYFLFNKKYINSKVLFLLSVSPIFVWFIRLYLNDYFLSDDFDHFVLVNKYSYWQIFIKGIMADNLWAFHRLFTAFEVFKVIQSFFGTNYYAYLTFNTLIHLINAYLLFLVLKKVTLNKYINYFSVFIYSNFFLTWISNIHELLAGFFFLLTVNLLINNKNIYLAISTFILGIYSKEIVFLLPLTYFMLLIFKNNIVKKIDYKKEFKKLLPIIFISILYCIIFIFDLIKFSNFDKGSGYDLVLRLDNLFNHFYFYLNNVLPFVANKVILFFLIFVVLIHDLIKRKFILLPLYIAYTILIFPVLLLNKNTAYYNYIPNIFIIIFIDYMFNILTTKSLYLNFLLLALFLTIALRINIPFQENCFLIQYPRQSARREAIENILEGKNDQSFESKWFIENNYMPYFK